MIRPAAGSSMRQTTMNTTGTPDILITDLWFGYNDTPVLERINLRVEHGEFLGIIGPNGGGKTTLLKLILGLLTPDRGSVLVFGRKPAAIRHRIGYVPQHLVFDRNFPATVEEIVLMGRLGQGRPGPATGADRNAARRALAMVGLDGQRGHRFGDLSGGQRQRALIARALAADPAMLLFDEPTANVDSASGEQLYHVLRELNRRMTILVVSHDIGFVKQEITSVVCVNRTLVVHPTIDLNGRTIIDMYGHDLSLIRHDHRCAGESHQ